MRKDDTIKLQTDCRDGGRVTAYPFIRNGGKTINRVTKSGLLIGRFTASKRHSQADYQRQRENLSKTERSNPHRSHNYTNLVRTSRGLVHGRLSDIY